jgi:hypothetical protein
MLDYKIKLGDLHVSHTLVVFIYSLGEEKKMRAGKNVTGRFKDPNETEVRVLQNIGVEQ